MGRRARSAIVVMLALVAACGGDDGDGTTELNVLAATSLTDAFGAIEQAFETANPGVNVTMSFGGSSTLATQIQNGAPADVFASADEKNMDLITDLLFGDSSVFTTNELQIMVAPGNPRDIRSLADLTRTDVIVITAQPGVPIRTYTDDVLANAGVVANFRSFEANVGGIVTKITGGAADAGIVYRTDVIAAGSKAQGVRIPLDQNLVAQYPIGVLAASTNRRAADAFVAFVNGPGQSLLASYGFGDG
ncbi:MAG: molybdate ABC transporter substrate-binding protein [Acidimicrobiales bacterium mtb01]|nr:molybdate ABC transporter substrate-binding protein [Actinomycetota bacterium]TEX46633.1 MAG: molybdate ABC transporter substrate-binding protein [Acidimicrobiales bacterium mtb01]